MKLTLLLQLALLSQTLAFGQINSRSPVAQPNSISITSALYADGERAGLQKINLNLNQVYSHPTAGNLDEESFFPARGKSKIPDWGLALSGGGIRSASFSIGVMKALYDLRILDETDVISSVSGGGYASYWLFTSYASSNKNQKFGESAFSNDQFIRNICKLQEKGDFITKNSAIKALFKSRPKAFGIYEKAILKTFGDERYENEKIDFLNDSIADGSIPYFIFNAALKTRELGKLGQVVEITPAYMGNPVLGFYKWKKQDKTLLRTSKAVAISGAAIKWKLEQPIANYARESLKMENLRLSDGGFAENLAALPLIRRAIKNIIIVDAEHDPKYKFDSYKKLRKALYNMDIDFCIPGIGECLVNGETKIAFSNSAVSEGYARSKQDGSGDPRVNSRIFYIKMSKPASIFAGGAQESNKINTGIKTRADALKNGEILLVERNRRIALDEKSYECEKASGMTFDSDMYLYRVNNYDQYLRSKKLLSFAAKLLPETFRYRFPQIPTFDQNYYSDQLEAFVALGYLQAIELKEKAALETAQ